MRYRILVLTVGTLVLLVASTLVLDRQGGSITPIFFHVIVNDTGTEGVISEEVIRIQIDSLNHAFVGSGLTFDLAGVQEYRRADWFNTLTVASYDPQRDSMFAELSIDPEQVINVFTALLPEDSDHGLSSFPDEHPEGSPRHGILLDYRVLPGMGGKPNQPKSDEGDWLIHEMGHYFGLFHTFEAGPWVCSEIEKGDPPACASSGDLLCGTPPHLLPIGDERVSCAQTTCTAAGDRDVESDHNLNFMNYTSDDCRIEFTPDQLARMQTVARDLRPQLVSTESISVVKDGVLEFDIYPNPATEKVSISFDNVRSATAVVKILDASGRQAMRTVKSIVSPGRQILDLDVSLLATGTYIVTIQHGEKTNSRMFSVLR